LDHCFVNSQEETPHENDRAVSCATAMCRFPG
jgi:hypothetical protein